MQKSMNMPGHLQDYVCVWQRDCIWVLRLICSFKSQWVNALVKTRMRHFNSLYSNALFTKADLASLDAREKDLPNCVPKIWLLKNL